MSGSVLNFEENGAILDAAGIPEDGRLDPLLPLALRARDGDSKAFELLYRETRDLAYQVLFRLVGPHAELDDLLQETFLRLHGSLHAFRGEAKVTTFLYGVCANVVLMHFRKSRRRREESVTEIPEQVAGRSSDPEHAASVRQAARLLQRALEALTPEKRVVYVYHEFLGLRQAEIAQALDISPNTVRSRLSRARTELVDVLTRHRRELERARGVR